MDNFYCADDLIRDMKALRSVGCSKVRLILSGREYGVIGLDRPDWGDRDTMILQIGKDRPTAAKTPEGK